MEIYIDTADIEQIKEVNSWGILDGVTTNPSLVAKEGVDFHERIKDICTIVKGPVSAEVTEVDADKMVAQGEQLAKIADNVVVKLPCTLDGIKACSRLSSQGIRTNMTLCFQPLQALLAAKAGAFLVSPFLGRLDDIGGNGVDFIHDIRQIYDNYGFETKILSASIRSTLHLVEVAKAGTDVVTIPHKVIAGMLKHPLTDSGLEAFLSDWNNANK